MYIISPKHIIALLSVVVFYLFAQPLFAQKSETDKFKQKKKKIEAEIEYTNKLLSQVSKNKKSTVYELRLLNNKINKRNELIAILKREIYLLDKKIAQTENSLKILNNNIIALKKEYAHIAYYLYRNNNAYNKLIFLFSAEDLNQAYQRLRYMEQMSVFVKKQANTLKKNEDKKSNQLKKLTKEKTSKKELLNSQNNEIKNLEIEQKNKNRVKKKLIGKEKKLKTSLRIKQREARRLQKQIENIIYKETTPVVKKGKTLFYNLSPEEKKLSKLFVLNKGKLPWPVSRGVISETFGVHNHPVLKHIKIKNNGVDIATVESSKVRAVFKGKVVSIVHITNTNIAIIIKHGEYFTVYSNLDKVFVEKNNFVNTKEIIGKVHTNLQGKTELHFEVWKGKILQNPAYWLSKK